MLFSILSCEKQNSCLTLLFCVRISLNMTPTLFTKLEPYSTVLLITGVMLWRPLQNLIILHNRKSQPLRSTLHCPSLPAPYNCHSTLHFIVIKSQIQLSISGKINGQSFSLGGKRIELHLGGQPPGAKADSSPKANSEGFCPTQGILKDQTVLKQGSSMVDTIFDHVQPPWCKLPT